MPIFDNELINNTSNRGAAPERPYLASPDTLEVDVSLNPVATGNIGGNNISRKGMSIDEVSSLTNAPSKPSTFNSPMGMARRSELIDNQRYPLFQRDVDLENVYGLQQGVFSQLGSSLAKTGIRMAGTFAQSLSNIPNAISAAKNTDVSKLAGNPNGYEGSIDHWVNNFENTIPNYYTRYEKEHPHLAMIPGFSGSANFWGESVLKNLGFTAGAIAGAAVQDLAIGALTEGLGEIPLVANQIGKASLYLNKILNGTNDAEKVLDIAKAAGAGEKALFGAQSLANAAAYTKVANGFRYGTSLLGSAMTEAGVEGRDSYETVKKTLLENYKLQHPGEEITAEESSKIEEYATNAMNTRFGINMALLTVSNAIQFDNLFKSFTTAEKGIVGSLTKTLEDTGKVGLKEGSLDVFEKKTASNVSGKIWDAVKPKLTNILSEGVYEEGGQYAAEKGTFDYYTRQYKNLNDPKNKQSWDALNETLHSTAYGLSQQFNTTEGIDNMIVGGLTAVITGGIQGKIDNVRGVGKDARLTSSINILNKHGLTGILSNKYDNTLNSIGIAKEMEDAANSNNIFKYKNLKHKMFFNFVQSRIPSGMHDITVDQLSMLKDLSKEDFEQTFGMDFNTSNKKTVDSYVDKLIDQANSIKETTDALNNTYKNPFKYTVDPVNQDDALENSKYGIFENWKTDLAYFNSEKNDSVDRLESIQNDLTKINPMLTNNALANILDRDSLTDLSKSYEEEANRLNDTITEYTSNADKKYTRSQIKALRTNSEKINIALNNNNIDLKTFHSLLNFELNNQDVTKDDVIGLDKAPDLYNLGADVVRHNVRKKEAAEAFNNLSTEKGFDKYFKQAEDIANDELDEADLFPEVKKEPTFVNDSKEREKLEVGREYEINKTKRINVKKIADDRYQVTAPDGTVSFHKTKEAAQEEAKDLSGENANLSKVKVIGITDEGLVKVEDINGDILNINPKRLNGYKGLLTNQEKLQKIAEEVNRQQIEIEKNSGTVSTPDTSKVVLEDEGALKAARKLFISGTTESETDDSSKTSPAHITRSREFLNNAKSSKNRSKMRALLVTANQLDDLGLTGILQDSYKVDRDTKVEDIKGVTDINLGWVAQVFVVQEKGKSYFVDKDGNKLNEVGTQVDLDKVIFQTMPTTSLEYTNKKPRYRSNEKEEAIAASESWKLYRTDLFNESAEVVKNKLFSFSISRGIPNEIKINGVKEKNHVGGILIDESLISSQEDLITIPTTGTISHNDESIRFPNGIPVLTYGDTVQFLNNRTFNREEAFTVFEVIKNLSNEVVKANDEGKAVRLNSLYTDFLQHVLYWKTGKVEKGNHISIDIESMQIKLGDKLYPISDIANFEKEITDQLQDTFQNVNNKTLTNYFSKKFSEYYINKKGELDKRVWKNYQTYLLSSKDVDGNARKIEHTPLSTSVAKPTAAVPNVFKQKYATLQDVDLPIVIPAKPIKKTETSKEEVKVAKIGTFGEVEYDINNDGEVLLDEESETFKTTLGNIINKAKPGNPNSSEEELKGMAIDYINKEILKQVPVKKEEYSFDGKTENVYDIPKFGKVTFAVKEGKPAIIDWENEDTINTSEVIFNKLIASNEAGLPEDVLLSQAKGAVEAFVKAELQKQSSKKDSEVVEPNGKKITRKFIDLENAIIDFEPAVQSLFDDPTIDKYESVISNYEFDLSSDLPSKELRSSIESKLRDVKNSFDVAENNKPNTPVNNAVFTPTTPYGTPTGAPITTSTESQDIEKPKSEKYNPNNTTGPSEAFRRVGKDSTERMTEEELVIFKEWHAANVPNIPFDVLDNLIQVNNNEKAWGVFENGVAKFVRGGLRATEYHEIFEGIYKGMLSTSEQQALLEEFKAKQGTFVDRASGKKILFSEATDTQAKERIADDFSDYRKGKLPARSLGETVRNFFSKIMEFFKSFVAKSSLKQELFKAIEAGKFKERTLDERAYDNIPEYRKVGNLDVQQVHEYIDDMTARAAGILFKEADKEALFAPDRITSQDMFEKIEAMYEKEGKLQELGLETFEELKIKTKDKLRTLGIDFNVEDKISINEEGANKNDYAPETFSIDNKKAATFAVKYLMATLIQRQTTNQEDAAELTIPEYKESSIKGYQLLNFSRAFATVLDKLSNTSSISKVVDILKSLAENDANYVSLFQRLGGKMKDKTMPFDQFETEDWRLFIQFVQTFTKQKPEALIQYVIGSEVYIGAANLYSAIEQTKRSWIENMKTISVKPARNMPTKLSGNDLLRWIDENDFPLISLNTTTKTYQVNKFALVAIPITTIDDKIKFLNKLGIDFTVETYASLKTSQRKQFNSAVSSIRKYLGENNDIMSMTNKTLGINGSLSTIAELFIKVTNPSQESTHFGVEGERRGDFTENNTPSVFENEFNESKTLDELLDKRPELTDVFSTNSQILKKGGLFFDEEGIRIKDIKVKVIEGTIDNGKGTSTTKLGLGERFTQEINQNLNGNYYIIIPADGSTEWMIEMGNAVDFKEIENDNTSKEINTIFKGYLMDDIALAMDSKNREHLLNIGDKGKQLRFFKDILSEKDLTAINEMIEDEVPIEKIVKYINDNIADINESIKDFIDNTVQETKDSLIYNGEIYQFGEDEFAYYELEDEFIKKNSLDKGKLSEKSLNDILTFVNVNYIINNIEYHKIIFGDPFQFAVKKDGSLDEPKRVKSFLSPRRTTFDSPEFNTHLNQKYNVVNGVQLTEKDYGYHEFKSYTNTITIKNNIIAGSLSNLNAAYGNTDESDAMAWLMDGTYREIKIKNGQWDLNSNNEKWHQWQMAYTRQNIPGYKYESDTLRAHDEKLVSKKAPKHTIEVLKPIVTGNKFGENQFHTMLDKFSQMPIYYSMVKGTNLENLYLKMFEENIGYAIVESGRKVGAEKLHSLYNGDGSFNKEAFNNNVPVSWKSYGIQVETASSGEKTQTRGSQLTKISSIDLFNNGVPTSEEAKKQYERNIDILNRLHANAYNELLKSYGIVDLGDHFVMENGRAISETLMHEMMRRAVSDNVKDTLELNSDDQFLIPFEASPSYLQIRSILYAGINKSLISPGMTGGAHVQVAVTMFESALKGRSLAQKTDKGWEKISKEKYNSLTEEEKKSVVLTDDTLKFYTEKEKWCEVMLPHWFKEKFSSKFSTDEEILNFLNSTDEGKSILTGIGFRIPTQALSSVEVFRVKGFLPSYMGATVVVPSEITTKAGSDFDIDKLNMYLKSIYIDINGNIKLVKLVNDNEEDTKSFFTKLYDDTLLKEFNNLKSILNIKDDRNKLFELINKSEKGISLKEEDQSFYNEYSDIIDELIEQADDSEIPVTDYILNYINDYDNLENKFRKKYNDLDLKEKYVNRMYKKALENEYYDSLEKLIQLPENFKRLISPIDDAGLKDVAKELQDLRGIKEEGVKNKLLNRNYLTSLRHSFTMGKKWVGVVAVNITNLSLKQKSKVYIDPSKINSLSKSDSLFIGDGKVLLDHNTVNVDGQDYISLSGVMTADESEYISTRLSGYASAVVDVAKDDYITRIIQSDLVIGTFMFLENIGAGKQAALFLNQPIINEYLNKLNAQGAKTLFNRKSIQNIRDKFPSTVDEVEFTGIDLTSLDKNIENYYQGNKTLSSLKNAEQQQILTEFLKYAKMAEFNFKFTQATNYDTTRFGSGDELTRKQIRTRQAKQSNIISSVQNILDSTFIGKQVEFLSRSMSAMGVIFKLEQNHLKIITDDVLKPFAENEYLSADKFNKMAVKVKAAFLDYIIQTKTGMNDRIKELLVDPKTSIATKLETLRNTYPEMKILKELEIVSSDRVEGAKSVKLKANIKEAYDENLYTGMMRELRDFNEDTKSLYEDLIVLSIFQGSYQSAISIKNIIPIEDYSKIVEPVVSSIVSDNSLVAFSQGMFQKNNFKDDDIMPETQPKFFLANELPVGQQLTSTGEVYADIYQYYSTLFPNIDTPMLSIKRNDRKVLLLSEQWDSYIIKNEFVKVPRVITDKSTGDSIDIMTNKTVTKRDFALRKSKGDLSLQDVFGYQKVYYSFSDENGDRIPLTTYNEKVGTQHVYKLVNLYGDGIYATENYTTPIPSVINNGTMKINNEVPDSDLIDYYGSKNISAVTEESVSLQDAKPESISKEEWDGLSQEEKNKINEC